MPPELAATITSKAEHIRTILKEQNWSAIYNFFTEKQAETSIFVAAIKKFCAEDIQPFLDILPSESAELPEADGYPQGQVQEAFYHLTFNLAIATKQFKLLQNHPIMPRLLYIAHILFLERAVFTILYRPIQYAEQRDRTTGPLFTAMRSISRHVKICDHLANSSRRQDRIQQLLNKIEAAAKTHLPNPLELGAVAVYLGVLQAFAGIYRRSIVQTGHLDTVLARASLQATVKERVLCVAEEKILRSIINPAPEALVCISCARYHYREEVSSDAEPVVGLFAEDPIYKLFRHCSDYATAMYCSMECQTKGDQSTLSILTCLNNVENRLESRSQNSLQPTSQGQEGEDGFFKVISSCAVDRW